MTSGLSRNLENEKGWGNGGRRM